MDAVIIGVILIAIVCYVAGYKLGWNDCVEMNRTRQIEAANAKAEQDRR